MKKRKEEPIYLGWTDNNISIWSEYKTLVDDIFKYYETDYSKFNFTSVPIIYLMSHAIELGLKENILEMQKIFPEHKPKHNFEKLEDFELSHDCFRLHNLLKSYIDHSFKVLPQIDFESKKAYKEKLEKLGLFISEVNPKSSTYRYSSRINLDGTRQPLIERNKKIEILNIYKNFQEAQTLLWHTLDLFNLYYGFKILKNEFPQYKRGIGRLALPIASYGIHGVTNEKVSDITRFLERHKKEGSLIYIQTEEEKIIKTLIPNHVFFNEKSGEYLEFLEVKNTHFLNVIKPLEARELQDLVKET